VKLELDVKLTCEGCGEPVGAILTGVLPFRDGILYCKHIRITGGDFVGNPKVSPRQVEPEVRCRACMTQLKPGVYR
jgi:hypothetical protein